MRLLLDLRLTAPSSSLRPAWRPLCHPCLDGREWSVPIVEGRRGEPAPCIVCGRTTRYRATLGAEVAR